MINDKIMNTYVLFKNTFIKNNKFLYIKGSTEDNSKKIDLKCYFIKLNLIYFLK